MPKWAISSSLLLRKTWERDDSQSSSGVLLILSRFMGVYLWEDNGILKMCKSHWISKYVYPVCVFSFDCNSHIQLICLILFFMFLNALKCNLVNYIVHSFDYNNILHLYIYVSISEKALCNSTIQKQSVTVTLSTSSTVSDTSVSVSSPSLSLCAFKLSEAIKTIWEDECNSHLTI